MRLSLPILFAVLTKVNAFNVISFNSRYTTRIAVEPYVVEIASDEKVETLVTYDELERLSIELAKAARIILISDGEKNAKELDGKDENRVGISLKTGVRTALVLQHRDDNKYNLEVLTSELEHASMRTLRRLTGNREYESGDLKTELDKIVKSTITAYSGDSGDLLKELNKRVEARVGGLSGKDVNDVREEIEDQHQKWMENFLDEDYNFFKGDDKFQALRYGKGAHDLVNARSLKN
mmetsp:Transcript_32349/g.35841  ORF Transcript_32349/g.35841 Transcript_32349/m.35841 type:complete len:237 (+) Transcript_32349:81-791(+)